MKNFFEWINSTLNSFEDSAINTVSIIVPWFVPIIPAYLTYWHTTNDLQFPSWVGWTAAFVAEFLGLAAMRTSVSFYEHNKRYSSDQRKAPFWTALLTYVFYLVVVLVVNVLLDLQNGVQWGKVLAIGLFSLLSVPAGVLISVRAQHTELLRSISKHKSISENVVRTFVEPAQNDVEPISERSENRSTPIYASQYTSQIYQVLEQIYQVENRIAGPTEVAKTLNLDPNHAKGFISTKTKEWKQGKGLLQ